MTERTLTPADHARAASRLVLVQTLVTTPIALAGGAPLAVGAGIALATLRWADWATAPPRQLMGALRLSALGTTALAAALALGGLGLVALPAVFLGACTGLLAHRFARFPRLAAASTDAASWAREHRDEFTGEGTRPGGIAPRHSFDPLSFPADARPTPPEPDPWDRAWGSSHATEADR